MGLAYYLACNEITVRFLTLGKSNVNLTLAMTGRCIEVKMQDFPTVVLNKKSTDSPKLCALTSFLLSAVN